MSTRLEVRDRVMNCTNCELNERCTAPVPLSGPNESRMAVVGEAPSVEDDRQGKPFAGKAGQLLRGIMEQVGLDPEACVWLFAAACAPLRRTGRTRCAPLESVNACSDNRAAQLRLANPQIILLVGTVPLHIYRPDLRMAKVHGRPIMRAGRVFFPIINPEAALRNPAWADDIRTDLSLLVEMDSSGDWTLGAQTCVKCGEVPKQLVFFDNEGIPYCETHRRQDG